MALGSGSRVGEGRVRTLLFQTKMLLEIIAMGNRAVGFSTSWCILSASRVHLNQTEDSATDFATTTNANLAIRTMNQQLLHLGTSDFLAVCGVHFARASVNQSCQKHLKRSLSRPSLLDALLPLGFARFLVNCSRDFDGCQLVAVADQRDTSLA